MQIVTICKICEKEYCYDPKWEPKYKEGCQECIK